MKSFFVIYKGDSSYFDFRVVCQCLKPIAVIKRKVLNLIQTDLKIVRNRQYDKCIFITVFNIIDCTNITNRLFLRRAIFIKISEAIVDVKCPEIFDAVICECNELPSIGLEFT